MPESKHFVITGRVQGVSFRANACKKAQNLGLRGWVRNLPDGRVEALALGAAAELESFERWLWQGPEQADVTNVEVESTANEALEGQLEEAADFQIR